ncbi:MAG: hypothetical protein A2231_00100 [Candidatus Firestonebacteria bacterium RIFOXYA2_FULL_40_8]|nr:MAG: hypothetical protein A2231_00100 [Candidatus Firestonebacteria bacterium RIFOXYA2_FULL_40_8]
MVRFCFRAYFVLVHRISVRGLENIPKDGRKLVVVCNHASYFDGPILWAFLGLDLKMLVNRLVSEVPLLKPFMNNHLTVQIDPLNSYSLKKAIDFVNEGVPLLVFPEGRVTTTGNLMKMYDGAGFIAAKTGAFILPVNLKNTDRLLTSKAPNKKRIFSKIIMTIGKIQDPLVLTGVNGREKRQQASTKIYDMLANLKYEVNNQPVTLGKMFIDKCRENAKRPAFMDISNKEITYKRSLTGGFALGGYFAKFEDKNIGVLLPNITPTALLFFGLQLFGKTPAFLNYSGGPASISTAMEIAKLNIIVTSKQFLEKIKIDPAIFKEKKLIYIEELKNEITAGAKVLALIKTLMPNVFFKEKAGADKETAVILFTSGSEGIPKGVCLSHENIISNVNQALAKIDVRESDVILNALPIFHSFGLTVGTILPFYSGAKTFLYVSPLHYRVVPEIAYDQNCTILLGTSTFLNGFSKKAHPFDFYSLRYIFCGAEALSEKVFENYAKTYGKRILTGYGATECAPIVSMNNAMEYEHGTAGRFLPGIEYKLEKVEGIEGENTGRLYVKGKNIMKGYLNNEKANNKFLLQDEGWYDTGDIVEITPKGYVKIVGRLKRFAKISGEMISLTAVEEAVNSKLTGGKEAAILFEADEKKGEKLILIANNTSVTLKEIREILSEKGFSELAVPRDIRFIKEIPKLGTGKVDYVKLKASQAV